jgi:glucose/arabinose dehydrogenase
MNYLTHSTLKQLLWVGLIGLAACNSTNVPLNSYKNQNQTASPAVDTKVSAVENQACTFVKDGFGPQGKVKVGIEEVASGLEVPWGIAFLPRGDMLVTERPGRVRLVQNGKLQNTVVASVKVAKSGEGGLLGIAVHPDFAQNRFFYLYYTADKNGSRVNRVERWQLSSDRRKASPDRIIIDDIPAAVYHDGGRLRFGPDGMLYIGTGDGRKPNSSQDINSLAGKILRLTPDGQVPQDNPFPNNPVFVTGIRNTQGFDWLNKSTLWVTDHGPSGELGRTGHDKVSIAKVGDNLGWPVIYGCESRKGMVTPSLSWEQAVPPGGAAIYTGNTIPEWKGNLIVGTLGSRHLHRIVFDLANPRRVRLHEVYFQNQLGRLREVVMGPDGQLYVTTSNCDGRGECPPQKDKILRITR